MSNEAKIYFVVEMLRHGDREQHSYIDGIYDDELLALKEAWSHMEFRDGKYMAEVSGYQVNGSKVYSIKLDNWDTFAASHSHTATKIREMIDKEEATDV